MTERLFLQERLEQTQALLQQQGRVSVAELCERFDVSAVTVRTDLATLEQQGDLVRTRGGAVSVPANSIELPAFALRKDLRAADGAN